MATIIKILDAAFTGDGAAFDKIKTVDQIESEGSLVLLDATHPSGQFAAGSLANAQVLTNLLRDKLAEITEQTENLDSIVAYTSHATYIQERSTLGGVHGICKQNDGVDICRGYTKIKFPTAVVNHINANPTHSYYFSLWQRLTKKSEYTGPLIPEYAGYYASAGTYPYVFRTSGYHENTGNLISKLSAPGNTNGLGQHFAIGLSAIAAGTYNNTNLFLSGGSGAYNSSGLGGSQDVLPSTIFYRAYAEDLTISGRTFAQVSAIDAALFDEEVMTEGGRYYGDTYTDPETAFA